MVTLSSLLPCNSNYLRAIDIPADREFTLEIDHVAVETIECDGHPTPKPVLYFRGKKKGFVLNRTNLEALVAGFGDEEEGLHGKSVIMFRATTSFRGQPVPCLRLRPAGQPATGDTPF